MRSVRKRIIVVLAALAVVAVGGWQLLPSDHQDGRAITVGTTDTITSLDPAGAYDAGSWALFSNVFQSLLTFEPDGVEPVPDAARRCGFQGSELTTYRCELRTGPAFPSGRKMTAADVKFSFDRLRAINAKVGPAPLFSGLDRVDADGGTVTFHLKHPDATFPFKLATGAGSIVDRTIYPAGKLRTGRTVDGTGVYRLDSYRPGTSATLKPNSGYRGAAERAGHAAVLRYYGDSAALDAAWKGKRVDVATRTLSPGLLAGADAADKNARVTTSDSAETRNLYLNVRSGSPFHDRRVREALARLIDRDRLGGTVYRGTVEPLYSLVPRGLIGHTTAFFDAYQRPDRKKAEALLRDAGVKTPVRFSFGYGKGVAPQAEATELARQLNASGLFRMEPKGYEWTDFQHRYAAGKLDAYAVGWVADFPDPDTFTDQLVGSGAAMKNGYSSHQVDTLITDTQRYADRSRITAQLRTLQRTVAHDVPLIPLWQRKDYVLSTEDVTGGQYLSDGTGVFRLWRLHRL
ncbi:ABC transporter substrate-binding protein [Streptomyces sp. NPDC058045]|uniref:ABC transporter substrate-binding protein n=1 Tax=Streptomyces sp. NPDC058045 TaxID=3346311 RepID=UPI0036EB19D9